MNVGQKVVAFDRASAVQQRCNSGVASVVQRRVEQSSIPELRVSSELPEIRLLIRFE